MASTQVRHELESQVRRCLAGQPAETKELVLGRLAHVHDALEEYAEKSNEPRVPSLEDILNVVPSGHTRESVLLFLDVYHASFASTGKLYRSSYHAKRYVRGPHQQLRNRRHVAPRVLKLVEGLQVKELGMLRDVAEEYGGASIYLEGSNYILAFLENYKHAHLASRPAEAEQLRDAVRVLLKRDAACIMTRHPAVELVAGWRNIRALPEPALRSWVLSLRKLPSPPSISPERDSGIVDAVPVDYISLASTFLSKPPQREMSSIHEGLETIAGGTHVFGLHDFYFRALSRGGLDPREIYEKLVDAPREFHVFTGTCARMPHAYKDEVYPYLLGLLMDKRAMRSGQRVVSLLECATKYIPREDSTTLIEAYREMQKIGHLRTRTQGSMERHVRTLCSRPQVLSSYVGIAGKIDKWSGVNAADSSYCLGLAARLLSDYPDLSSSERLNGVEGRVLGMMVKFRALDSRSRDVARDTFEAIVAKADSSMRTTYSATTYMLDECFRDILAGVEQDAEKMQTYIQYLLEKTDRATLYCLGILVPALPSLLPKVGLDTWRQLVDVIAAKKENVQPDEPTITPRKCRRGYAESSKAQFLGDLSEALKTDSADLVSYYATELTTLHRMLTPAALSGPVNLESVVIGSIKRNVGDFSGDELSNLHRTLAFLYVGSGKVVYPSAIDTFKDAIAEVRNLPIGNRRTVIEKGMELARACSAFGYPAAVKNKIVDAYYKGAAARIGLLGTKFTAWMDRGIGLGRSADGLLEYIEDKGGYYDASVQAMAGGMALQDIELKLRTYARSLCGREIGIQHLETGELRCSFKANVIYLPKVIAAGDEKENFSLYKALTSFQAGALEFGTYPETDDENARMNATIASFAQPAVARAAFEILEFARIDAALRDMYPGLRKDLDRLRDKFTKPRHHNSAYDEALWAFRSMASGGEPGGLSERVEALCCKIKPPLQATVGRKTRSLDLVKQVYELLVGLVEQQDAPQLPHEPVLDISLNEVVRREPGFLVAEPHAPPVAEAKFRYPEWDGREYQIDFVQLREMPITAAPNGFVAGVLERDSEAIDALRARFETIKPEELVTVKKQVSGELDYDMYLQARIELARGLTPSEKIYCRTVKSTRSVAALVLAEVSGSTRKFLDLRKPDKRIIDVIKESMVYLTEALEILGDSYSLAAFSGETEKDVKYFVVKAFGTNYDECVRHNIGSLQPLSQNRDGAGIRHATHQLLAQPERTRILIYLAEGVPHDYGYENARAINDTFQALQEAGQMGVIPITLVYGGADKNTQTLADAAIYREIRDPKLLPLVIPELYANITV